MVEFFKSIGQWFVENKDAIVAFLSSAQFAAFVTLIVSIVKGSKGNKEQKANLAMIQKHIANGDLISINNSLSESKECSSITNSRLAEAQIEINNLNTKVDTLLKAISMAYSKVTDDELRENVTGVIDGALALSGKTVTQLKMSLEDANKQIVKLEQERKELMNALENYKASANEDTLLR